MKRTFILILFAVVSLLFTFEIPKEKDSVHLLFKIIPLVLLLLMVWMRPNSHLKRWVLAGLAFCMLGDAFIIFAFLPGLVFFLIGHLFYIGAFLTRKKEGLLPALSLLPIAIYGVYMGWKMVNALQQSEQSSLIIPVIIYILAISLMGWAAIMTRNLYAAIGSLLFITSDSILSWNLFVSSVNHAAVWIMLTYYAAQGLIACSIPAGKKEIYIRRTNYQIK